MDMGINLSLKITCRHTSGVQPEEPSAPSDVQSARVTSETDGLGMGGGNFVEIVLDGSVPEVSIDASKTTASVTSSSFSGGVSGTSARSIDCLSRRFWFDSDTTNITDYWLGDDGAGNSVVQIVLDRPIYTDDTSVALSLASGWISGTGISGDAGSVTLSDTGDEPYPVTQAHWATENFRPLRLDDATFEVCAHAMR